eukprot:TRINITY_DN25959_c0_g1_i1.p2 TRINITY_DN25959_c0_g1~~TRINITY_DN25959_c0_g1_i1.p2  ORF type:complete len:127 (+),score=11.46 TRINITY_DN25959_c0_g1_i1:521-901(+)
MACIKEATIPSQPADPVAQRWDEIAQGMAHVARQRQLQHCEEKEREQVLDENCLGLLKIFQDFRRGKEEIEARQATGRKLPAPPPPRPYSGRCCASCWPQPPSASATWLTGPARGCRLCWAGLSSA